nr:hypothetical protein CFP56_70397 [Quercus suber]
MVRCKLDQRVEESVMHPKGWSGRVRAVEAAAQMASGGQEAMVQTPWSGAGCKAAAGVGQTAAGKRGGCPGLCHLIGREARKLGLGDDGMLEERAKRKRCAKQGMQGHDPKPPQNPARDDNPELRIQRRKPAEQHAR